MSGKVTVLTPVDQSKAIELGRSTWRKQVLPIGQLRYGDRTLHFTRDYIKNVVTAFRDGAFDAVPLQLASAERAHSNDPERSAGEVIGLEAGEDGLYATFSLTDRGSELVREHPNLGVSVRMVEDYARGDGKHWPVALQHVAATWTPRVAGMKPWQAIECAEETSDVIDLSELVFKPRDPSRIPVATTWPATSTTTTNTTNPRVFLEGREVGLPVLELSGATPQATQTPTRPGGGAEKGAPVAQLNEEELAAVRAALPIFIKAVEDAETPPVKADTPAEPAKFVEPPTAETAPEPAPEKAPEPELVAAADDTTNAVELALIEQRTQMDRMAIELAEAKAREDAKDWAHESAELVRDYGIPPAIVQMAEPLLKGRGHTVELAEGNTVDAGQVLRSILATVAKTYGRKVDLSGPVGTAHEMDAEQQRSTERDEFLARQRAAGFATH